jgi:5-methylcytosine-specific restriction endonuclease McrA
LQAAHSTAEAQTLRVTLDPGSKTTGIAVVHDANGEVVWAAGVSHRDRQVKERLERRRSCRRSRRQRHTRYRQPRLANVLTWVRRLQRLCPIGAISQEVVRFDSQLLENAEISGVEYQQGELVGYEARERLLEKWERRCASCGQTHVPLEVKHIVPQSRGGSNRVSNLTIACHDCDQAKGNRTAVEWGFPGVQAPAKAPLKDAAAVNATRWALYDQLRVLGLPMETAAGGRAKWNRAHRGLPKSHWMDASRVGASTPPQLQAKGLVPLLITAMGRHSRQMCRTNAFGFADTAAKATSAKAGVSGGRIAVRATGSCNSKTAVGTVEGVRYRYCQPLHRADGYMYTKGAALPPHA